MRSRPGVALMCVALVASSVAGRGGLAVGEAGTEQRIADFWQRLELMDPSDLLSADDLRQWAVNLSDREPAPQVSVADFRAAAAQLQAGIDRAGPVPTAPPSPQPTARRGLGSTPLVVNGCRIGPFAVCTGVSFQVTGRDPTLGLDREGCGTWPCAVHLSGVNLYHAWLDRTNLDRVWLDGANLAYADLRYADAYDVDLHKADLSGATLAYADLTEANLRGANLTGATLTGTKLWSADLTGAVGANVAGASLCYTTLPAGGFSVRDCP